MWLQIGSGVAVGALVGRSPTQSAIITGATIGTAAAVRRLGIARIASAGWFGVRAIGAMTIQGFVAGVVGGALVGTAVSYVMFGKEGAKAAVDFYTDPFDIEKAKKVRDIPKNIQAQSAINRAVENNALNIRTGTPIDSSTGAPERHSASYLYYSTTGELRENWQELYNPNPRGIHYHD